MVIDYCGVRLDKQLILSLFITIESLCDVDRNFSTAIQAMESVRYLRIAIFRDFVCFFWSAYQCSIFRNAD